MPRLLSILILAAALSTSSPAREFSVVPYNLENLFDLEQGQ